MGLGVLYCVISKFKFFPKITTKKPFISKVFYFSVVFLIKVFFLQQKWIQQLQFIFSHSRTTSLCELHREFHYSTVTASRAILSCNCSIYRITIQIMEQIQKVIQIMGHKLFVSKYGTLTYSNYGTLKIVTQIMGHFRNHGIHSQNNVCLYIY